ncbi:hypothetical protein QWZ06_15835 [Chryseobacterium tructae]|uniref:Uncharacterized protein n=1 Tax=Chryseobacterium tructae TaxID=1037380 RepID=A0ABV7XY67_9FLAO|nr:hypothetical protein [Chryseobacterium tructae]MDN3693656.1 hypothetical protein [Chryseobacterium tructae]
MKRIITLPFAFLASLSLWSQVGIGTASPDLSAILELQSANKGILIPRVALTGSGDTSTIPTPATGLMVYNTGENTLNYKGFVYWNGKEWISLNNTSTINPSITGLNCSSASAFPLTFTSGSPYNGSINVPYSGGNGGSYLSGTSFIQNGLIFTENAGTLNNGNGTVSYTISGTPNFSSPSTISVPLNFLGKSCSITIGNNSSSFQIGEIKSSRITVPAAPFIANGGSRRMMNNKGVTDIVNTDRRSAYELASSLDQSKYIIINGLRMDFIESWNDSSVSPKLFNTTSSSITYNISSLSTNDSYKSGVSTVIATNSYSYNIDGNDDFSCSVGFEAEYVNAMITFNNGEWYNCTWHATRDNNNYYFYMTAQRLN